MARYEREYGESMRGFDMRPGRSGVRGADPNYRGGYGGLRMEPGYGGQAAYGWHRATHRDELGGYGGYRGVDRRYDQMGGYRTNPVYNGEYENQYGSRGHNIRRGYDNGYGPGGDGGVRGDTRYLGQYNSHSPGIQNAPGRGYDRNFGWAPGPEQGGGRAASGGRDPRHEPLREHGSNGYNSGGFSEMHRPRQAYR